MAEKTVRRVRFAGTGVTSRPHFFCQRQKKRVLVLPKKRRLAAPPEVPTKLSGAQHLNCLYVMLRCRFRSACRRRDVFSIRRLLRTEVGKCSRRPFGAAVAGRLLHQRQRRSGLRQFKFRTPETEARTEGFQRFLLLGHPKPRFLLWQDSYPRKRSDLLRKGGARERADGAFQKRRSIADFATTQNEGFGASPVPAKRKLHRQISTVSAD